MRLPSIPVADLLEDARVLWRSRTVKALVTLAITTGLGLVGMAADGVQFTEAVIGFVDYALIIAGIYFRARAQTRMRLGAERRNHTMTAQGEALESP